MQTKQSRYRERQKERGMVSVTFWIPKEKREQVKRYIDNLTNKESSEA